MHDISEQHPEQLPSARSLRRATLLAALIAAAVLVTAVLPAEYGIDPTGIGRALGLTSLNQAPPAAAPEAPAAAPPATLVKRAGELRSDEMALPLMPGQGAEIKAVMAAGDHFVFRWTVAGGAVSFDMHGERHAAAEGEFTSYWLGEAQSAAGGSFRAPFAGTHGFYWQNDGTEPVTVRLQTSGFYEALFMP